MDQIGLRVGGFEAVNEKRRPEKEVREAITRKRRDETDVHMAINRKKRHETALREGQSPQITDPREKKIPRTEGRNPSPGGRFVAGCARSLLRDRLKRSPQQAPRLLDRGDAHGLVGRVRVLDVGAEGDHVHVRIGALDDAAL